MKSLTHRFTRQLGIASSLCVALTCSACMTGRQMPLNTTEAGPVQAIYKEPAKDAKEVVGRKSVKKPRESEIQQLNHAPTPEASTRVYRDSAIQGVAYSEESQPTSGFQLASGNQFAPECPPQPVCPPGTMTTQVCPPEPRWPAAGPNPMAPGMMACDACNMPSPESYTDEYLCDGGDRAMPMHYDQFNRLGLDTEDTVLEFTDRDGKERVKPTNKVCVYAPRFASVRTVSRPVEGSSSSEASGVGQLASTSGLHSRLKASNHVKREMTGRMASRSRASGMETEEIQGSMSQLRHTSVHEKVLNLYEALTFVRFGRVDDADSARLNYGIQAASAWTREEYPVISSKTDMALEGHFEQSSAAITVIEEKTEAENLRIVKLADKKTALPGEEIEFTIRYDNLGGRDVYHIRIVDNLTPRLQYIEGSATSDRDGKLVLQDNGEGSQIVIWELEEPLKGKSGGVVTFKARVR